MKRFYMLLIAALQANLLSGHGFSGDTLILLADNAWQQIDTVCYRTLKSKIAIASYDTTASCQTTTQIIRSGRSQTNCYIQFAFADELPTSLCELQRTSRRNDHAIAHSATAGGFEESQRRHDVVCTPTQEFHLASKHQWVPAYMLKKGDELLCANNVTKTVAYIALINEPLPIFTVEVKHTHTFFVTQYSLLTHNMVLPIAFNIALSIPFGAAAGGTAGSFFGPITFVIGAAVGCMVGVLAKIVCSGKVPTYTVEAYDANSFEHHVKQQPQIITLSEPQVALSPDYVTTQHSLQPEPLSTGNEHIHYDDSSQPLFSTTTVSLPKEKPGCGDTTPQKALILITPAEPMPVFQNPGYRPLSDEERNMLSGGCTIIPISTSEKGSNILFTEEKTAEEIAAIVNELEKNAQPGAETKGKTKQYIVNGTYDDAVSKFHELTPKNTKIISSSDGKTGLVGDLVDGRTINVRTDSTHGAPTLEIYKPSNERKLKFRYTRS